MLLYRILVLLQSLSFVAGIVWAALTSNLMFVERMYLTVGLLAITLLLGTLQHVLLSRQDTSIKQRQSTPWLWLIFPAIGYFLWQISWRETAVTAQRLDGAFILSALLLLLLACLPHSRKNMLRTLPIALIIIALANFILCYFQVTTGDYYPFRYQSIQQTTTAWHGFFETKNTFALFFTLIGLTLWCLGWQKIKYSKWHTVHIIVAVGCFISIYFTQSRGGLLTLALGLICWLTTIIIPYFPLLINRLCRFLLYCAVLLFAGVIIIEVRQWQQQQPSLSTRATQLLNNTSLAEYSKKMLAANGRDKMFTLSARSELTQPWLGGGPRYFSYHIQRIWDIKHLYLQQRYNRHLYNEYIEMTINYGIIGLVILLFFYLLCCGYSIKQLTTKNVKQCRQSTANLGLVIFTTAGFNFSLDFNLHSYPIFLLLAIIFCLVVVPYLPNHVNRKVRFKPWWHRFKFLTYSFLLLLTFYIVLPLSWQHVQAITPHWQAENYPTKITAKNYTIVDAKKQADAYRKAAQHSKAFYHYQQAAKNYLFLSQKHPDKQQQKLYHQQAIQLYKQALSTLPQHGVTAYHLGKLHQKSDLGKAAHYFEMAAYYAAGLEFIYYPKLHLAWCHWQIAIQHQKNQHKFLMHKNLNDAYLLANKSEQLGEFPRYKPWYYILRSIQVKYLSIIIPDIIASYFTKKQKDNDLKKCAIIYQFINEINQFIQTYKTHTPNTKNIDNSAIHNFLKSERPFIKTINHSVTSDDIYQYRKSIGLID